jgi:Zn-dependent M28 family amino/carboxypeptidase
MKRLWLLGAVLLLACGTESPPADPGPEDPDTFVAEDSVRIMADLELLSHDSLQGRRTGEPGNTLARDYLLAAFQEAGLQEPPAGFVQPFEFTGRRDTTQVVQGANVVGWVPGTDLSLGAIVLTAHFDHVGTRDGEVYNGADDNASGTAALISMARYVVRNPLRHSVIFAAVDAEEMGLRGARAFVAAGWPEEMVLNVNMDMISRSDSLLFAVGTSHYPHLKPILEGVADRPPVQVRYGHDERGVEGVQDWTGSSDQGAFHDQGIPFVYFGVEDHPDYHQPTDDFDLIDPAFYINAIRTVLASTLALDAALPVPEVSAEPQG